MLFLLPIHEKISLARLPVATVLISLALCLTFIFFQLDDKTVREEAKKLYYDKGIDKIELPQYIRFARRHMHVDVYYKIIEGLRHDVVKTEELYWAQHSDPIFQGELAKGNIINETHPKYREWRKLRREYEFLLSKDHAFSYGFKSAQPSLLDLGRSFFLHGSWQHLLGNVIFLFFVGMNLEILIGSFVFVLSLAVIHTMTVCVFGYLYPFSLIPLIGASGGIAGLLGIHALMYRFKKIDFFVNILFYFNTLKLPGMIVIPLWLGWELLEYYLHPVSSQSYSSHLSGFVTGLLIGALLYRMKYGSQGQSSKGQERKFLDFQSQYNRALDHLSELNFPQAKRILFELHENYPQNQEVLFNLFNVTKIEPSSDDYHLVIGKILSLKDNSKACVSMTNIIFKNYIKNAEPSIRFDPNVFLNVLHKFRRYGYLDDAEKILKIFVQFNKSGKLDEMIAREQLQLVRSFMNKNDTVKAKRILDWCWQLYPQTASAKEAKRISL